MQNLMPGYDAEEVTRRVNDFWMFLHGYIPWPKGTLRCQCGSTEIQLQRIGYAKHRGTIPWRVNVNYKCCVCSRLWIHGVPITEEAYDLGMESGGNFQWREVQALLEEK